MILPRFLRGNKWWCGSIDLSSRLSREALCRFPFVRRVAMPLLGSALALNGRCCRNSANAFFHGSLLPARMDARIAKGACRKGETVAGCFSVLSPATFACFHMEWRRQKSRAGGCRSFSWQGRDRVKIASALHLRMAFRFRSGISSITANNDMGGVTW